MSTFTPTTYGEAIGAENKDHPTGHSMWRLYGTPIPTPYTVIITSGVASPSPGVTHPSLHDLKGNAEVPNATASYAGADSGSGDDGRAVFTGGRTYTVTAGEETILLAAGYSMD